MLMEGKFWGHVAWNLCAGRVYAKGSKFVKSYIFPSNTIMAAGAQLQSQTFVAITASKGIAQTEFLEMNIIFCFFSYVGSKR